MTSGAPLALPAFDPTELRRKGRGARLRAWARDHICLAYPFLRLLPNLRLGHYVIVARRDDVEEVLANTRAFHVRSGIRLAEILDASGRGAVMSGFGTDDPTKHQSAMKTAAEVFRLDDAERAASIVQTFFQRELAPTSGTKDLGDLFLRAAGDFAGNYFGLVKHADPHTLSLCCQAMVNYAFGTDKLASPGGRVGRSAAAFVFDAVRQSIVAQKPGPDRATIIGRLVANPNLEEDVIQSLVIIAMMAQVAISATSAMNALRFLLHRPDAMRPARAAAVANDNVALGRCLMEALRFYYIAPAQLRDCALPPAVQYCAISAGTWRRVHARNGDIVVALQHCAMFDGRRVSAPRSFDPGRDAADNLIFGFGMHRCAGFALGRVLVVQLLKPLLLRDVWQTRADRARVTYFDEFPECFPAQLG